MSKKSNIYSNNQRKILSIFYYNPSQEYNLREISERIKVAPSTTTIALRKLIGRKLLLKVSKGKSIYISANLESEDFQLEKKLHNIRELHYSGLIQYLKKMYTPEAIILFGSYSRGEDIENSDIDIAIITRNEKEQKLFKFEQQLHKKIHILKIRNIQKISNHLAINILNGIIISGAVEW